MDTHAWIFLLITVACIVFGLGFIAGQWERREERRLDANVDQVLGPSEPSAPPTVLNPAAQHAITRGVPAQPTATSVSYLEHVEDALRIVEGGDRS